ncbi:hypothetical protein P154DRAFT_519946 [Amniculicola lignicola CBS 123094]|uniref:C2H2-type domain-containing protein n=1 Tax=Amniculicola lignicola CBS 123094 TaxID=1392246 RepID=A0A6A5X140_9PLEO|nr:hypothetical protein P154DRAFT_519946 [Amniculicola lignicola CBS 123094]
MSKQLLMSEHYKAYKALGCAPFGVDTFTENADGLIEVQLGEIYCRVKVGNELCGNVLQSRGALVNHIKKHHEEVGVQAAEATGNPKMSKINDARRWYSDIMQTHDGIASARASQHNPNIPPPPPPTPRRRSSKKTTQHVTIAIPTGSNRFEIPTFTRSNKKRGEQSGDVCIVLSYSQSVNNMFRSTTKKHLE